MTDTQLSTTDGDELTERIKQLEDALRRIQDHCYCNRLKGFDYGEKHPKLGKNPEGNRWLTPSEIATRALLLLKRKPA
jgi:hypothetical protein